MLGELVEKNEVYNWKRISVWEKSPSSQMQFLPILGVTVNTGKDVYARTYVLAESIG